MLISISVYALADKYEIAPLKALAKQKVYDLINLTSYHYDFPTIVNVVYSSTSDSDRGLRDIVADFCAAHFDSVMQFEGPSVADMKETAQFAFDTLHAFKEQTEYKYDNHPTTVAEAEEEMREKDREVGEMDQMIWDMRFLCTCGAWSR